MPRNKKKQPDDEETDAISSSDIPKQEATETHIDYEDKPATSTHEIHPRQPLPPIPEGEDVDDDCPSPPTEID